MTKYCTCRVPLYSLDGAIGGSSSDVIRGRVVCEVQCHQGLEVIPRWHRSQNSASVLLGHVQGADRRDKIRHDNGSAEDARGMREHGLQHVAIAHVQMEVIRRRNLERRHCWLAATWQFGHVTNLVGVRTNPKLVHRRSFFPEKRKKKVEVELLLCLDRALAHRFREFHAV